MQKIPSVDLQLFLSNKAEQKEQFVNQIGTAFSTIGFVALKGHFLSDALVTELYQEIQNFFNLPQEIKSKYEVEGIGGQRGYTSFGKESAKGKKEGDLKEFWHFGQYVDNYEELSEILKKVLIPNILVEELPNFNRVGKEVYQQLEKTAKYVLRALALYLEIDEIYFDEFIHNGNSILRPIHYPPIHTEPKGAVRAAAHGDINLITLLMGAQGKGLQVQNLEGNWIDAIAQDDELMINVGDMLSRLTNNQLKSTIHQVVNPPKELWGTSRYSIPFFMHPVPTMNLTCLDNCVSDENPKQFEDITAGDYLTERLIELGLIKA
ncbi:isopenicillin N synthase family oxygenase [Wenyingzhuangia sp. 2_MG-2023]|uniref:isopenicillin N synthase family dioxygenase n=1 Tax=Wenyingzhuangia sp. 2_MG-2023 TaxID=3062639 RepID=UPI0026E1807B|nr:2-oxoglutarate and iron-dependent oxygenase domain-containing protein [Wenyingzhuangia sp. 2_MG-2023]MDO6738313.1 2-oxoglutarate and iron-dependent oxygenase domain-containing protein [Wenyingzhuangia sp. 2_MG-2023]